jgi:tetratricopeptide (TPR) repeat protein
MRRFWMACAAAAMGVWLMSGLAAARQDDPRLNSLFERLRVTKSEPEADQVQSEIWRIWMSGGNAKVDARMAEGVRAMNRGQFQAALAAFNAIIAIAPDFAEGWNKRATVLYMMDRYDESADAVQRTLALEPRHFGALAGLGLILTEKGDEKRALNAFEQALQVNPHMSEIRERARALRDKVKGKPI